MTPTATQLHRVNIGDTGTAFINAKHGMGGECDVSIHSIELSGLNDGDCETLMLALEEKLKEICACNTERTKTGLHVNSSENAVSNFGAHEASMLKEFFIPEHLKTAMDAVAEQFPSIESLQQATQERQQKWTAKLAQQETANDPATLLNMIVPMGTLDALLTQAHERDAPPTPKEVLAARKALIAAMTETMARHKLEMQPKPMLVRLGHLS